MSFKNKLSWIKSKLSWITYFVLLIIAIETNRTLMFIIGITLFVLIKDHKKIWKAMQMYRDYFISLFNSE